MKCHQEPIFFSPVVSIVNKLTHEQSPISLERCIVYMYIYFFFFNWKYPRFNQTTAEHWHQYVYLEEKVTEYIIKKSITTIKISGLESLNNTNLPHESTNWNTFARHGIPKRIISDNEPVVLRGISTFCQNMTFWTLHSQSRYHKGQALCMGLVVKSWRMKL